MKTCFMYKMWVRKLLNDKKKIEEIIQKLDDMQGQGREKAVFVS